MKIEIINTNITTLKVDAIVNAANNSLAGGGGVDGAIHKAAGKQLTDYCIGLGGCKTGFAKIPPGFNLHAKFIIHAVGPVWNNGTQNEEALLAGCYQNSLQIAVENDIKTIAFPCISTGAYRFPFDKAGIIAINAINNFLSINTSIEKVFLVVYSVMDLKSYYRLLIKI